MRWRVWPLVLLAGWPAWVAASPTPPEPPRLVVAEPMEDRAVGLIVLGSVLTVGGLLLLGTGAALNLGEGIGTGVANSINGTFASLGGGGYEPAPEPKGHSEMVVGGAATAIGGAIAIVIGCAIYANLDEAPPITAALVPTPDGGVLSAAWRF